jgi:hypothetical protein
MTSEPREQANRAPRQLSRTRHLPTAMAPPPLPQLRSKEADIYLAILAINSNQVQSIKRAAAIFSVPESTLRDRRAGVTARHDCVPNSKKLTKLEEEVIVKHVIELDSRGFSPTLGAVREMANKLLAERSAQQVGLRWPQNFVNRTERLRTRFNRPYDR